MDNSTNEKYIYLIRHGETEYNKKGYLQGSSINSSLNESGKNQAELFYQSFKHIPFDKIYTSVLIRSIESVEKFINSGILHESYTELNEINWGSMEGKLLTPFSWIKLKRLASRWSKGETHLKIAGGESPEDVMNRQIPVAEIILSRNEEKNILICMHGRALRIFLCILTQTPLKNMDTFHHSNLGLYVLKYNNLTKDCIVEINNSRNHLIT